MSFFSEIYWKNTLFPQNPTRKSTKTSQKHKKSKNEAVNLGNDELSPPEISDSDEEQNNHMEYKSSLLSSNSANGSGLCKAVNKLFYFYFYFYFFNQSVTKNSDCKSIKSFRISNLLVIGLVR